MSKIIDLSIWKAAKELGLSYKEVTKELNLPYDNGMSLVQAMARYNLAHQKTKEMIHKLEDII